MCGCHDAHHLFSSEMNTVDRRLSVKSKQQDNYIASSFKSSGSELVLFQDLGIWFIHFLEFLWFHALGSQCLTLQNIFIHTNSSEPILNLYYLIFHVMHPVHVSISLIFSGLKSYICGIILSFIKMTYFKLTKIGDVFLE